MSSPSATPYDQTPYISGPQYSTHPDHLATNARLMGLAAADPHACRVLELGCGDGGNLIPLALALPGSQFLGLDLSPVQIELGKSLIARLGISNIELRTADIMEFAASEGEFDYILCHGVFSWVPSFVQERILAVCRDHLAPQGVAHISYNAYPGWHYRAMVRDMVLFETRDLTDPQQRVSQARAYLKFLSESIPERSPLRALVESAVETFDESPDWYLLHEYLETDNHPLYFHEFMAMAERFQLQYVCEGWFHTRLEDFSPKIQATIRDISENWLQIEQHVDFLTTRTFRRTLLCRADAHLPRVIDASALQALSASALAEPMSGPEQWIDDTPVKFHKSEGRGVTTNNPVLKLALGILWERLPQAIPVGQLAVEVRQRLGSVAQSVTSESLGQALLQCYLNNLLTLHSAPPRFNLDPSRSLVASPLARIQAETRDVVVNLRHQMIDVSPLGRCVLMLLDGRPESAVIAAVERAVVEGTLQISPQGGAESAESVNAVHEGTLPIADLVRQSIQRLSQNALLMPTD